MTKEYVILVDKDDSEIGLEEKIKCHLPNGKLHRAFTALLFDNTGKLVLTKRSPNKMLWPGDWDGTVASHPRKNESYTASAERRMPEEMGISCKFDYLFKFEYHVPYKDVGSENEICGTLISIIPASCKFNLVEDEITEIKWITPNELIVQLEKNPEIYCPWMLIALFFLAKSNEEIFSKYRSILVQWVNPKIKKALEESIKFHLRDNIWRLVK